MTVTIIKRNGQTMQLDGVIDITKDNSFNTVIHFRYYTKSAYLDKLSIKMMDIQGFYFGHLIIESSISVKKNKIK